MRPSNRPTQKSKACSRRIFCIDKTNISSSRWAPLCMIFIIFGYTIFIRMPFIGELSDGHHQWLTAHSLTIVNNWLEYGIFNERFMSYLLPRSIETPSFYQRVHYVSYPLGAQLPIFLIKNLFPRVDTIWIIHLYGLLAHLSISIIIYLM